MNDSSIYVQMGDSIEMCMCQCDGQNGIHCGISTINIENKHIFNCIFLKYVFLHSKEKKKKESAFATGKLQIHNQNMLMNSTTELKRRSHLFFFFFFIFKQQKKLFKKSNKNTSIYIQNTAQSLYISDCQLCNGFDLNFNLAKMHESLQCGKNKEYV